MAYGHAARLTEGTGPLERAEPPPFVGRPASVCVQATRSGDGQSTVALGLAIAWSLRGARVLLVDLTPSEDLSRLLHVGRALASDHASSLLTARAHGQAPVPASSVLDGVDLVSGGATASAHPDAVARCVLEHTEEVRLALATAGRGYARVLVDAPRWPPALARAAARLTAHTLHVSAGDRPHPSPGQRAGRSRTGPIGTVLNRWSASDGPDAAWLGTAIDSGRWLDTTIARVDALRDAWNLVLGRTGPAVDANFDLLARELDARIERGAA